MNTKTYKSRWTTAELNKAIKESRIAAAHLDDAAGKIAARVVANVFADVKRTVAERVIMRSAATRESLYDRINI